MKTPDDYIGMEITADVKTLPVAIINKDTDEKIVYCQRYTPTMSMEAFEKFYPAGVYAYEIYIVCADNKIEDINHRIEPLPCSQHSHAPHGAPASIFPEGAMFDIEWENIIPLVRKEMLNLLDAFFCASARPEIITTKKIAQKKLTIKRKPVTAKKTGSTNIKSKR